MFSFSFVTHHQGENASRMRAFFPAYMWLCGDNFQLYFFPFILRNNRYKIYNSLLDLDGRPRRRHPLGAYLESGRDKAGMNSCVLRYKKYKSETFLSQEKFNEVSSKSCFKIVSKRIKCSKWSWRKFQDVFKLFCFCFQDAPQGEGAAAAPDGLLLLQWRDQRLWGGGGGLRLGQQQGRGGGGQEPVSGNFVSKAVKKKLDIDRQPFWCTLTVSMYVFRMSFYTFSC